MGGFLATYHLLREPGIQLDCLVGVLLGNFLQLHNDSGPPGQAHHRPPVLPALVASSCITFMTYSTPSPNLPPRNKGRFSLFFGKPCGNLPGPLVSGVCEGFFFGGPFIKISRLLFHWHRGARGIPPRETTMVFISPWAGYVRLTGLKSRSSLKLSRTEKKSMTRASFKGQGLGVPLHNWIGCHPPT